MVIYIINKNVYVLLRMKLSFIIFGFNVYLKMAAILK